MTTSSILIQNRRQFLLAVSILAIISSICWPLLMIIFHFGDPAIMENGVILIFSGFGLLLLYKTKTLVAPALLFSTITLIGLSYILFLSWNDSQIDGLLYFPIAPLFFYLVWGKRYGTLLTLIFVGVLTAIGLYNWPGNQQSILIAFQLSFSIGCIVFMLFYYQDVTDKSARLILDREHELETNIKALQDEFKARTEAENALSEKVTLLKAQSDELARMNKFMVNRELFMITLKEKIKSLEQNKLIARE